MTTNHEHISTQFDAELEEVRSRMLRMGGLVEEQLRNALAVYATGDRVVGDLVDAREREVNAFELDLDDRCTHVIARRQPAARDLRLVLAVVKATTDLERVGDEAAKIARIAVQLHERSLALPVAFSGLRAAGHLGAVMLREALDAFARSDVAAARTIVARDREMDDEFRRLFRELLTFMIEDPRTISAAMDVLWMAKALERIGDHAKNIAQYVIFIAEGIDVRHGGSVARPLPPASV